MQADHTTEPPIGGALYFKPGLRGRWRVETAGTKWVVLRSLEVVSRGGSWALHREPRESWPNGWVRA